ncbi:nuclear transport factor 2 family protein [Nocardia yamanashiensis]|uniref:nuclear transport factor 2 family protein n=1 Tax=Nocardia yamanashiensis TaxID=209247 RepID=UPI00082D561F|nr:nuclear transport factor 2 family protein [Nocardia yamanashiensis]
MTSSRRAVISLLHDYADALDRRDWASLNSVFAADVTANYSGAEIVDGRERLTGMIRGYLDKCGPTQHLMGHERAVVDGDRASVSAKMRVHHIGADRPDLTFEVFGWYHAEAARTPEGWRIVSWRQEVTHEVGTYEVFGRK